MSASADEHAGGDRQRPRARQQLHRDFLAEVRFGRRARGDQAARHRDEQRRDRRDQAFADRQDRVGLRRGRRGRGRAGTTPMIEAGDDVDAGDEHGGQRVALGEADGAVHRAVEVGFAAHPLAARRAPRCSSMMPAFRSASIAICRPGIASRVNRAVTSEMRTAPWLMTMNWIAISTRKTTMPTTKLPPTTNWPNAMITWPAASTPSCAVHQDQPRRRDVQRQPDQRQQQQQRREHRELDRLLDVDRPSAAAPPTGRCRPTAAGRARSAAAARSSAARPPGRRPARAGGVRGVGRRDGVSVMVIGLRASTA